MQINLHLSRKPTGKIAELPPDLIEYVNHAIYEGVKYDQIIRQLAARGYPGFNKNNLSRWRRSGHAQWVIAQDRRDAMRVQSEAALAAAQNLNDIDKQNIADLNEKLVAMQAARALMDAEAFKTALATRPDAIFKVARLATLCARESTRRKMANLQQRKVDTLATLIDRTTGTVAVSGREGLGEEATRS